MRNTVPATLLCLALCLPAMAQDATPPIDGQPAPTAVLQAEPTIAEAEHAAKCKKLVRKAKRKAFWGMFAYALANGIGNQRYATASTTVNGKTYRTTIQYHDTVAAEKSNDYGFDVIHRATQRTIAEAGCQ